MRMVLKVDDQQMLTKINALSYDSNFHALREIIETSLEDLRRKNDDGEGMALHQRQGACQFADQLLAMVQDAREVLTRMRENERRGRM